MSGEPRKNLLNGHSVSGVARTLTSAGQVPQETDSRVQIRREGISAPTPEQDEGSRIERRKEWGDDEVATEASVSPPTEAPGAGWALRVVLNGGKGADHCALPTHH